MLKSEVKRHFKTLQAIAKALNITKSAVSQWPERVPKGAAYELQVITGGTLQVRTSMYRKEEGAETLQ